MGYQLACIEDFCEIFTLKGEFSLLKHQGLDKDKPENYRPISNLNTISWSLGASVFVQSEGTHLNQR